MKVVATPVGYFGQNGRGALTEAGAETEAGADVRAVIAENERVHRELDRLRGLLRRHGIEPADGTARTA
jgi:hypothetical protein